MEVFATGLLSRNVFGFFPPQIMLSTFQNKINNACGHQRWRNYACLFTYIVEKWALITSRSSSTQSCRHRSVWKCVDKRSEEPPLSPRSSALCTQVIVWTREIPITSHVQTWAFYGPVKGKALCIVCWLC